MSAGVTTLPTAVETSLPVAIVVRASGQIARTVVRRRTAGVAKLNGIPLPGVTTDTGRKVVVVLVVVATVVCVDDDVLATVVDAVVLSGGASEVVG